MVVNPCNSMPGAGFGVVVVILVWIGGAFNPNAFRPEIALYGPVSLKAKVEKAAKVKPLDKIALNFKPEVRSATSRFMIKR